MSKKATGTGGADSPDPKVIMDPLIRWFDKVKARKKSRTNTWELENSAPSRPATSDPGASETTHIGTPSTLFNPIEGGHPAPESVSTAPFKVVPELSSNMKTPLARAEPNTSPTHQVGAGVEEEQEEEQDEEEQDEEEQDEEERDEEDNSEPTDDGSPAEDDVLFLLWDEACDALFDDDIPNLSSFRRYISIHRLRSFDTSDVGSLEPTEPIVRRNSMRQILESLLAEAEPSEDEGDSDSNGDSNHETELTDFSKFKTIVQQAALRESQRGAAVAWVAVCFAASPMMGMSALASPASRQCIVNILSAMEWYCSLPAVLLRQPGTRDQETRVAILDLYKAILCHLVCLASPSIEGGVEFLLASEENLDFPNTIVENERAVMACFDRSRFRPELDQFFDSLASDRRQTDTDSEGVAEAAPVLDAIPKPSGTRLYSFGDGLPEASKNHQDIQGHANSWIISNAVYKKFLHPYARDHERELWVVGKPGTGKSTLLEAIAQGLSRHQEFHLAPEIKPVVAHVAAFFCNRGKERKENAAAIVQCLVSQVLDRQTKLRPHFYGARQMAEKDQFDSPEDLYVISTVFQAMLGDGDFEPTCFVIDGIDECCSDGDEPETDQAMWALMDLISSTRHYTGVRWLVSADSNGAIKRSAPWTGDVYQKLELSLDDDSESPSTESILSSEVAKHVKLRVAELMRGMRVDDEFRKDIEDNMLEQSKGNFLWIDLAYKQILSHGLPWNAISFLDLERAPNDALPSGLEPLYAHMEAALDKLQWDSPRYCREIINTLAAAYRPLRLGELGDFLLGDTIPTSVDLDTIIKKECSAFLEIRDGRVFFVHQSAKNFFRKKMEDKAQRHSSMTLCCLRVLSQQLGKSAGVGDSKVEEFHHYATRYWLKHFCNLHDEAIVEKDGQTMRKVAEFFEKDFIQWLEALAPSSGLAQALTQVVQCERILQKLHKESNDALERGFEQVQLGSRFLRFHQSTQSPPEVSPKNSVLFCPGLGARRSDLLHTEFPWLSSLPAVEPGTALILDAHHDWVRSCAFSTDGQLLASASDDETIRIWDPRTGAPLASLKGFGSWVLRVRFSAGNPCRMATLDSTYVKVWNMAASNPFLTVQGSDVGEGFEYVDMRDISFSPDGKRLAVAMGYSGLAIWNVEGFSKEPLRHWDCPNVTCVIYIDAKSDASGAAKGGLLATSCGTEEQAIIIWSEGGEELQRVEFDDEINALAFCPSSKLLAAGSDSGEVRIWTVDVDDEKNKIKELAVWLSICSSVTSLSFSGDGSLLGVASPQNLVQIWTVNGGADQEPQQIQTRHQSGPLEISFSLIDSVSWMASCGHEGSVEVADVDPRQPDDLGKVPVDSSTRASTVTTAVHRHQQSVKTVIISPDSRLLATYSLDDQILLWDGDTGDHLLSFPDNGSVQSLFFSHDGAALAATFSGGVTKIWDTKSGKMTNEIQGHDDWIRGGAFSPPAVVKRLLATASDDRTVKVWDLDAEVPDKNEDDQLMPCTPLQVFRRHTDYAVCVAFSPDGGLLASAGDDGMVYIWDRTASSTDPRDSCDPEPKLSLPFNSTRVCTVAFSPDGKRVVASASNSELRIWDLYNKRTPIVTWQAQSFTSLQFSSACTEDETWILTEMGPALVGESSESALVSESESTMTITEPWTDSAPWSMDYNREWIRYKGKKAIFLPKRYRPSAGAVFVQGSRVAIGCRSGLVMLFRFSEDAKLLDRELLEAT